MRRPLDRGSEPSGRGSSTRALLAGETAGNANIREAPPSGV
jgi:hypothetical protein